MEKYKEISKIFLTEETVRKLVEAIEKWRANPVGKGILFMVETNEDEWLEIEVKVNRNKNPNKLF